MIQTQTQTLDLENTDSLKITNLYNLWALNVAAACLHIFIQPCFQ